MARSSDDRVAELLEANNRYQQEARDARADLAVAKETLQWIFQEAQDLEGAALLAGQTLARLK